MPIPSRVLEANEAGLRKIIAEASRKTRKRGFLGQKIPLDESLADLADTIRQQLRSGAAWLATLDPNVATESAYPSAAPLVNRMPEEARWAIIKLTILQIKLLTTEDPATTLVAQVDYAQEACDITITTHQPRRNLEPKQASAISAESSDFRRLTGPDVDINDLLLAAQIEIEAFNAGIAKTVERAVRAAGKIEIRSAAAGRNLAAQLTDFAGRHGLWFGDAEGWVGRLVFVEETALSTVPGEFALNGPAGARILTGGLDTLVAVARPIATSSSAHSNLALLRDQQERDRHDTMKAIVFAAEPPSLVALERYIAPLAKRDSDAWTPAARVEAVEAINYWKRQLKAEFRYDGQPCTLKVKDRGRRGFQLRTRGIEQTTIFTGLQLPKLMVRQAR